VSAKAPEIETRRRYRTPTSDTGRYYREIKAHRLAESMVAAGWTPPDGELPPDPAFDEIEVVETTAIHADESHRAGSPYVDEIAATDAGALPVIAVPLVVTAIRNRRAPRPPSKEH